MSERSVFWTGYGRSGSCSAQEGPAEKDEEHVIGVCEQASPRNDFRTWNEAMRLAEGDSRLGISSSGQPRIESAKRSPSHSEDDNWSNRTRFKRPCLETKKPFEDSQSQTNNLIIAIHLPKDKPENLKQECNVVGGGGVFSSRLPSPSPRVMWNKSNRIRVEDNRERSFPDFAGCPDWVKPLMYVEYQVSTFHDDVLIMDLLERSSSSAAYFADGCSH
jgi:hypothetical protein